MASNDIRENGAEMSGDEEDIATKEMLYEDVIEISSESSVDGVLSSDDESEKRHEGEEDFSLNILETRNEAENCRNQAGKVQKHPERNENLAGVSSINRVLRNLAAQKESQQAASVAAQQESVYDKIRMFNGQAAGAGWPWYPAGAPGPAALQLAQPQPIQLAQDKSGDMSQETSSDVNSEHNSSADEDSQLRLRLKRKLQRNRTSFTNEQIDSLEKARWARLVSSRQSRILKTSPKRKKIRFTGKNGFVIIPRSEQILPEVTFSPPCDEMILPSLNMILEYFSFNYKDFLQENFEEYFPYLSSCTTASMAIKKKENNIN